MPKHSPGTAIDLPKVVAAAAAVQREMQEAEKRLKETTVLGTAGGGAVKVKLGGDLLVQEVVIDRTAFGEVGELIEVVAIEGVQLDEAAELIGDMVQAAVNDAIREAQELAARMLGGMSAGGVLEEGL